jgi:hypothetical protein
MTKEGRRKKPPVSRTHSEGQHRNKEACKDAHKRTCAVGTFCGEVEQANVDLELARHRLHERTLAASYKHNVVGEPTSTYMHYLHTSTDIQTKNDTNPHTSPADNMGNLKEEKKFVWSCMHGGSSTEAYLVA